MIHFGQLKNPIRPIIQFLSVFSPSLSSGFIGHQKAIFCSAQKNPKINKNLLQHTTPKPMAEKTGYEHSTTMPQL